MKYGMALCVATILGAFGLGYKAAESLAIPLHYQWVMMAGVAAAIILAMSTVLMAASYIWPARREDAEYWFRDAEGIPYSVPTTIPHPHTGLQSLGYIGISFSVFLVLGIFAVLYALNHGVTLQALHLGAVLEPLAVLVPFALAATVGVWYVPYNKLAQPTATA